MTINIIECMSNEQLYDYFIGEDVHPSEFILFSPGLYTVIIQKLINLNIEFTDKTISYLSEKLLDEIRRLL